MTGVPTYSLYQYRLDALVCGSWMCLSAACASRGLAPVLSKRGEKPTRQTSTYDSS
jgi:hypothetical protein